MCWSCVFSALRVSTHQHTPPATPTDNTQLINRREYRRRLRTAHKKGVRAIRRVRPRLMLRARAPSDSGQRPQSRPPAGVRFAGERDDYGKEDAARVETQPGGESLIKEGTNNVLSVGVACSLPCVLQHANSPHSQPQQETKKDQRVMCWSCVFTVVGLLHTNPPYPQLQQITRS